MSGQPMNEKLQETVETFQMLDPQLRLEMLLDYANNLPPLPERLHEARDAGLGRVVECQSPVFLYTDVVPGENGGRDTVRIWADVPEQAPTVRGFVSLLVDALDGATPQEVAATPDDLLRQTGIGPSLGMTRQRGLQAVLHRIKHAVAEKA
jgi:cysteine desulfuration protein SufE